MRNALYNALGRAGLLEERRKKSGTQFMNQLTNSRQIKGFRLLFMFTYMVSYLTRINYGAVIVEMSDDMGIAASLLSLAVTGSFITYGTGQLISGYLGDRIQPKRLVFIGLLTTIGMNTIVPLCYDPWMMTALWCLNGFAQSFMWPPIVRLMAVLFREEDYKKATVVVSWGGSFGTIFVYLTSPVWIMVAGWRWVFWVSAAFGLVMLVLWSRFCPDIHESPARTKEKITKTEGAMEFMKSPLIWGIMLAIVLQGALRDGVTTWMPSYISDTFRFSNVASILTGVLLPLFSILSFQVTSRIYDRKPDKPLLCAGSIFLAGGISAVLLLVFSGKNAVICILCMAMLTACMHGVNLILVCMLPVFFKDSGNVSTVSGVLNSCTYVGSAISTYGIAKISESAGWNMTIALWMAIAMTGAILCFAGLPAWSRRFS